MAEVCCCGNELRPLPFNMRSWPCKCAEPGKDSAPVPIYGAPDRIPQKQVEERRRLGLPLMTDGEKAIFGLKRWE